MKSAILSAATLLFPMAAYAQLLKTEALITKSTDVLRVIVVIVFTLALIVFAWGIVQYLTAAGDAAKLKTARPFLWWGIIGMFVLASVWGLISFIAKELEIAGPETEGTIKPIQIR
ncbi:MAG: hypothetical protein AAB916_01285 [Patescibacteria group bacterium]